MSNISAYISNTLTEYNVIKKEDADICRYGIEVFCLSVLEILSVVLISVFMKNFLYTIMFFIGFIPLRLYAGGYHASTKLRCYLLLLAVYVVFTIVMKYIPTSAVICTEAVLTVFTAAMVLLFSPMIDSKKNISDKERKYFRKIALIAVLTETAIMIASVVLFNNNISMLAFSLGGFAVSLSVLAAAVKKRVLGGKDQ